MYNFERFQESCLTDVTHSSRGTFTWNKVPHGIVISIECSRGSRNYAIRQCVLANDGRAIWRPPDISSCPLRVHTHAQAKTALLPFTDVSVYSDGNATALEALELLHAVLGLATSHNKNVSADVSLACFPSEVMTSSFH